MKLFYKPENGYIGDVIPFYDEDAKLFRLFYLFDKRKDDEEHSSNWSWYLLSTRDFLKFSDQGEVIPSSGDENSRDYGICTGCVLKAEGKYHAFYVGGNINYPKKNIPEQAICHATSEDLIQWKKIPEHTFYPREDIYEKHDFRDPFVFWNEQDKKYWMFVTARIKEGPRKRRGCLALCKSEDLEKWDINEPFWSPRLYYVLECSDLFKIGDWWYLLFSENNEVSTHYRMSKSMTGPWKSAANDTFDATSFYAAKTAFGGNKRYLFGWVPRKAGKNDYNNWEWGGNLIVHEITQNADGTLSTKVPDTIDNVLTEEVKCNFSPVIGDWKIKGHSLSAESADSFKMAIAEKMPSCCKISANLKFGKDTRDLGFKLRVSDDLENGYYIRLEPRKNRMVFDMFPRKTLYPRYPVTSVCDSTFVPGHERFINLVPGQTYNLKIFAEDDVCVAYLDNKVALTFRMYNFKEGKWGVFVNEGSASFDDIKVFV